MPESIYIATSPHYEGIVKIGRTDRPVQELMDELSNHDYGLEGEVGDTEWEVANVIVVDENVAAEAMLHKHFDSIRVSDSRELFYSYHVLSSKRYVKWRRSVGVSVSHCAETLNA